MSYENKYYQEAVKFVEANYKFTDPNINVGYNKDEVSGKSDKIQILQNNIIIAMLTQIQNKIDNVQKQMFDIDKNGKEQEYEITKLTESLHKMNLGPNDPTTHITSRKTKINFLMYKKFDQI